MEYEYEVWLDGNCLHEEDGFTTEEEAEEEAMEWVADKLDEWESEGVRDGVVADDFEVKVREY